MRSLAPAFLVLATTIGVALATASDDPVVDRGWIVLALIICAAALWTPIHLLAYRQMRRRTHTSTTRTRLFLVPLPPPGDETDISADSLEPDRGPAGFWVGTLKVCDAESPLTVPLQLAVGLSPPQAAIVPVEAKPDAPRVTAARLLDRDDLTDEMDLELMVAIGRRAERFEVHLAPCDGRLLGGDDASEARVELRPAAALCSGHVLVSPFDAEAPPDSPEE